MGIFIMKLDIKKAFKSPFAEEKWYKKLIFPFMLAIFNLITNVYYQDSSLTSLIINFAVIILGVALSGFYAQFGHNEIHEQSPLLPDLDSNIKNFFLYGIKLVGIMMIYFSLVLIGSLFGLSALAHPSVLALFGLFLMVLGLFVGFPLAVVAEGIFFDNFSFKESLDIKKVIKFLGKVKMEVLLYIIACICFMMITTGLNSIVSMFGITIIFAAAISTAIQLALINFNAQVYKIAKSRLEDTENSDFSASSTEQ